MTAAEPLPEIELTLEQAAILFHTAICVVSRMETEEFDARPVSAAIPRSVMTCGDALMLIPAAMLLTAKLYPQLMDTEILSQALRGASMPTLN